MFFLSSQQLSPSPWPLALPGSSWIITCILGGFSSLGVCPLSTSWFLALSCSPKHKYQLLEEQGAFLGSLEGATQSLGDSLKERWARLCPVWCLLWIVTISHFSLWDRAVWPVLAGAIIEHLAGIPCAADSRNWHWKHFFLA